MILIINFLCHPINIKGHRGKIATYGLVTCLILGSITPTYETMRSLFKVVFERDKLIADEWKTFNNVTLEEQTKLIKNHDFSKNIEISIRLKTGNKTNRSIDSNNSRIIIEKNIIKCQIIDDEML